MNEQELLEKIRKSAEDVKIPENLSPETIRQKLKLGEISMGKDTKKTSSGFKGKRNWRAGKNVAAAAAILVLCGVGIYGMQDGWNRNTDSADSVRDEIAQMEERAVADAGDAALIDDGAGSPAENAENNANVADSAGIAGDKTQNTDFADSTVNRQPKQDAGDMYVVASNYSEIYDVLESREVNQYNGGMKLESAQMETAEDAAAGYGAALDTGTAGSTSETIQDINESMNAPLQLGAEEEMAEAETGEAYSKTNVQTEGVDESDIIKTDGSYIYIVDGDCVKIVDIRDRDMKQVESISVSMNSASDRIAEMYVDNGVLNLIVEKEDSELKKGSRQDEAETASKDISVDEDNTTYITESSGVTILSGEEIASYDIDVYYMEENTVTELLTYDISDRENPVLKGTVTQDGVYQTSRKIGDIVYLFTNKSMAKPQLTREEAVLDENTDAWIPLVNGEAVAVDCIYIPETGNEGLLVSSTNVQKPDQIVDNTLIINNHVDIYVSTGAMYIYRNDYSGSGVATQIAKFTLKEGVIDAVGATSAAGSVYDTFAVNEYQGKLRLLTTDWSSGQDENNLFVFDEKLKLTGKLTGLAKGEQIYAARYFGDMAYFVTYRNTDPLFAVDLSDEKNPKVLSELKITGFSEYLHFWGEDKLVGIGYETDPDTGAREGIKLTMFDISNPADLKTAGTCVIENLDYAPALYQYKCVLADAGENMIGFAAESCDRGSSYSYLLFSWEDGAFGQLMTETLPEDVALEAYRGLYARDVFYLASPECVISYDREGDYQVIEKLEL